MSFNIENFVVGPMPNNLYLLIDRAAEVMVIVDPSIGSEPAQRRVKDLESEGAVLQAIWNTHGHYDHIYDNAVWKRNFSVPLMMHQSDEGFVSRLREQALWFGMEPPETVPPDEWFEAGQILQVGTTEITVLHTPGHSPGSVSFYIPSEGVCISGDVLFRGSVGRTDLPGCSEDELHQSLANLVDLPVGTRILPGHGEDTTVGAELATNPFLKSFKR